MAPKRLWLVSAGAALLALTGAFRAGAQTEKPNSLEYLKPARAWRFRACGLGGANNGKPGAPSSCVWMWPSKAAGLQNLFRLSGQTKFPFSRPPGAECCNRPV